MPQLDHRPDGPGTGREMRPHDGVARVLQQADEERRRQNFHAAVAHGIGSAIGADRDDDLGGGPRLDLHGRAFTAGGAGTASPSGPAAPRSLSGRPGPPSRPARPRPSRPPPTYPPPAPP